MLGVAPWSWINRPDANGIVGLVRQHDYAWAEMVEQAIDDLPVMSLPGG